MSKKKCHWCIVETPMKLDRISCNVQEDMSMENKDNNVLNTFSIHIFQLTEKTLLKQLGVQNCYFSYSSKDVFNVLCEEIGLEEPINSEIHNVSFILLTVSVCRWQKCAVLPSR